MIRINGIYLPPNYTEEMLKSKVIKEIRCKSEDIKNIKICEVFDKSPNHTKKIKFIVQNLQIMEINVKKNRKNI